MKIKYFKVLIFGSSVMLLIFVVFMYIFGLKLNDLPKPSGKHSVGNILLNWQNDSDDINPKYKNFNVDIFYPIEKNETSQKYIYQPIKTEALIKVLPQNHFLPEFIWRKILSNVHTFTKPNAPIINNNQKFPIIIYLPGINSEDLHNVYLEELASHGYVIFAIEPPYDIIATVFPGNKIITTDPILKKAVKENNRTEIYKYRNAAHQRWNQYIESAIKNLKNLNNDQASMFYNKLDTNKIGLLGHSHGGAAITDFCQKNKLCKAGVNMDGWTKTYNKSDVLNVPFLLMLSQNGQMPEMQQLFINNENNPNFKKIIIEGSDHDSFKDTILINKPFTCKNEHLRKEISKNLVSFFDENLNRKN